jgi:SAM-dependent methyltransferase
MGVALTFDRTSDVSKLEGCNTRGIAYRWDIFQRWLRYIPPGSSALDFGAGSLRESFDLIQRGFCVTSVDNDISVLEAYKAKYQWPEAVHEVVAAPDLESALAKLGNRKFALILCFDVLEHLADPVPTLKEFARWLDEDGLLFVTVPNGRTLFELAFRINLMLANMTGRSFRPGEPHLQMNSPSRWRTLLSRGGFKILEHDMQIGFFANTAAALIQLPLLLGGRFARKLGVKVDAEALAARLYGGPQARLMDLLDRRTKPLLNGFYGWNLFVLEKAR